eukprot:COSAG02_NODE_86_length_39084_cov_17.815724_14_plen_96_part_00
MSQLRSASLGMFEGVVLLCGLLGIRADTRASNTGTVMSSYCEGIPAPAQPGTTPSGPTRHERSAARSVRRSVRAAPVAACVRAPRACMYRRSKYK